MELYELLSSVVGTFTRLGVPYLVTGSVASMAYGEPRLTNNIDIEGGSEKHLRDITGMLKVSPQEIDGITRSLGARYGATGNLGDDQAADGGYSVKKSRSAKTPVPFQVPARAI